MFITDWRGRGVLSRTSRFGSQAECAGVRAVNLYPARSRSLCVEVLQQGNTLVAEVICFASAIAPGETPDLK